MLNKKGLQLQAFLFDSWRALSFIEILPMYQKGVSKNSLTDTDFRPKRPLIVNSL